MGGRVAVLSGEHKAEIAVARTPTPVAPRPGGRADSSSRPPSWRPGRPPGGPLAVLGSPKPSS
jgi:hypothetical protein